MKTLSSLNTKHWYRFSKVLYVLVLIATVVLHPSHGIRSSSDVQCKITHMATRKSFTSVQKFSAALSIIKGEKSAVDLGRELSCHPTAIAYWRDDVEKKGALIFETKKEESEKDARIAKLERSVGRLVMENDFLEKVLGRHT